MIVTSIDTLTSLIGGFTIFAILGNLAHNLGIEDIGDVVKSGTGLAFIRLAKAYLTKKRKSLLRILCFVLYT